MFQFPANIVYLGAASIAAISIIVSGRVIIAALREMGNPEVNDKARMFICYCMLFGVVAMLAVGTGVALISHVSGAPPTMDTGGCRQPGLGVQALNAS